MTRSKLLLCVALAACGSKSSAPVANGGSGAGSQTVPAKGTELERRRDAACQTLGPKVTACAVEDAKKDLAAGKVSQKDFDANTSKDVLRKNTEEFIEAC